MISWVGEDRSAEVDQGSKGSCFRDMVFWEQLKGWSMGGTNCENLLGQGTCQSPGRGSKRAWASPRPSPHTLRVTKPSGINQLRQDAASCLSSSLSSLCSFREEVTVHIKCH